MQTLVYVIGGYCLIKAVLFELACFLDKEGKFNNEERKAILGATAFLFLAAIEAFNQ